MMAENPYMFNNFMQEMGDDNASMGGGFGMPMNFMNEYNDEIMTPYNQMQM